MWGLRNNGGGQLHPAVPHLCEQVARGLIGRREFLRCVALLGVALPSAKAWHAAPLALVTPAAAQTLPKSGGTLRLASTLREIDDPASITAIEDADIFRNALENLTELDADNVTRPLLAESWLPNADLTAWRFKLRRGVKWSNGDAFTSEDVAFNFKRWTAPGSKSSLRASFATLAAFEAHDALEFTLRFSAPLLTVPELLSLSSAAMLHRSFEERGGNWLGNPIGTGPFELAHFALGERCLLKRHDGYWGKPAWLEAVEFLDIGSDSRAQLQALIADKVDVARRIDVSDLDTASRSPGLKLLRTPAANTVCMRMKPSEKPFDDLRVRRAVVLAADNQQMLDIAIRGNGVVAENHHVAPIHPEYVRLPPLKRDVALAKDLLAQAGLEDGIDLELTVGNTQGRWEEETARVLQRNLAEAGIRLQLDIVPSARFWQIWTKVPFGLTYWAHRPLGVMALDLGYRSGADWNESGFSDPDFDAMLARAMALADPVQRSAPTAICEKILQEACIMVQPFWVDALSIAADRVQNFRAHPTGHDQLREVWIA
jgi:peptide/nickel transport system substrate-binding protein